MGKDFDESNRNDTEQENPDHDQEEVPGRPAVSQENLEQQEEEEQRDLLTRLREALRLLFRGRR